MGINTPKPTHSTPSYAGTYGPDLPRSPSIPAPSQTHSIATSSPVENWGWQDVEEMQQHQMFERNMAYKSPVNISVQTPIDYQTLWGEGVGPGVQLPPTTFDGAQLNKATVAPTETPSYEPSPALGLLPHLVVKVVNHVKTHGLRPTSSERPQQAPLVYSPYMRAHRRQTLSLETLPTPERRVGRELLEYVDQVVNQYAYETEHNFFQSNIDTHIGSLKGCGSFIEVTGGDLEEKKWAQLRQFERSEESVTRIDWKDLCEASDKFWQIVWITIIGCKDPKLIKSYQNDFEMYEACDVVIEVVDGRAFEVFSHNHSLIEHIRETFKDTMLLEPNRKDL